MKTDIKYIRCPDCLGFGFYLSWLGHCLGICELCQGKKKIKNRQIKYYNYGQYIYKHRIENMKLTLRQAAKKYNLDPSNLSKMERGILKPREYWK